MAVRVLIVFLYLLLFGTPGCNRSGDHKSSHEKVSPAKVTLLPKEANLADIELTPEAFKRLGITTVKVKRELVGQSRTVGGEITIPPGELAIVMAPVTGTLQLPEKSTLPKPGSRVEQGRAIFQFMPLLTPERFVPTPAERAQIANAQASLISLQMTADGDVQQSTEEVTAAEITLNRAEQLLKDRVGSERAVDDAKAQLAIAQSRLKVSKERKQVLDRLSSDIDKGSINPISIDSPISGVVRSLPVSLGQTVSTGTVLFEVVNLETVWIRVPVYVGLLNELLVDQPASIQIFGEEQTREPLVATPVLAPPAADPLSSTADLFYEIKNQDARFRPGERVSVTIPMKQESEALVIPIKALLYDMHGGTWVYERLGEYQFRRRRVDVQRTTSDLALLESGAGEGNEIVIEGTAELFGTEFGAGK